MIINLQRATMSMERDENYVPRMRSDYKLPPQGQAQPIDYEEIFEEMPLFTLGRMVLMQLFGMQSYLLRNSMGLPSYPPGTNVWPIAFFAVSYYFSTPTSILTLHHRCLNRTNDVESSLQTLDSVS